MMDVHVRYEADVRLMYNRFLRQFAAQICVHLNLCLLNVSCIHFQHISRKYL